MYDKCTVLAKSAQETQKTGASLARTLYGSTVTVALTGELGAGKTTFLQGFARALGIRDPLTSPTYALEQRYETPRGQFLHLDLYRLTQAQAEDLLRSSANFSGIRCIEWSERIGIPHLLKNGPLIGISVQERSMHDRQIVCNFHDASLPTDDEIERWRKESRLPVHIIHHCDAVAAFAVTLADRLIGDGQFIRKDALRRAAQVHDLFRFLDFRPGGHPMNDHSPDAQSAWDAVRSRYPAMHHEQACAEFLREQGFGVLAQIVAVHGLSDPPPDHATIEQKLLFYADKRVLLDRVVTLEERFADFAKRYGKGEVSDEAKRWYAMTKRVEEELFPS